MIKKKKIKAKKVPTKKTSKPITGHLLPKKAPNVNPAILSKGGTYEPLDSTALPDKRESEREFDPTGDLARVKVMENVTVRAVRRKKQVTENKNFLSGNWFYLVAMAVLVFLLIKSTKNGNLKK